MLHDVVFFLIRDIAYNFEILKNNANIITVSDTFPLQMTKQKHLKI